MRRLCARDSAGNVDFSGGGKGGGPEIGELENDHGEPGDPAASADVARQAWVECFFSEEASLRTVVVCSPPTFVQLSNQHEELRQYGCHFGHLFSTRVFFLRR